MIQINAFGDKIKKLQDSLYPLYDILINKAPEQFDQLFQLSRQIEEENQKLIKQYINFFIKNKEKLQLDIDAERKKEEEKQKKELPTIVAQKENKELKKLLDIQKEYEQAFIASEEINKFEEEMNYNTYKTELIIQKANE